MQRVTQFSGRVAALAVLALIVGAFVLWQEGPLNGPKVADLENVTVITFACQDYERDRYEGLAKDFQALNPDIRVQFTSSDEASGRQQQGSAVTSDGREIERLAAAADTFVWFASFQPGDWSSFLDLTPFVDDPSFPAEDFFPGTLDHFRWQGGIYGLPATISPILVFYDKGMFDEAGVPYPRLGWTWDNLIQAAAQLTQREGDQIERYGFVDTWSHDTVLAMLHQYGVSLWDEGTDPPQPLFDAPEVADVLRRYADLALRDGVMPVPEFGSNVMAANLIDEGKAATWTAFAYNLGYHARRTDLGLVPFPEQVNAANPRSMYGFFISAGTAHPDAAWRWLSYLSANHQPWGEGRLPGRRSVAERLSWWKGLDEETRAVFEHALAHPSPSGRPLDNVPLLQAMVAVFEDGTDVEQALAMAQARALELQADLAQVEPAAPQPVATPRPTPGEGLTVVTFATAPGADMALYRQLASDFQTSHPTIQVEIIPQPSNWDDLATVSDCFASSHYVAAPEVRQLVGIRSLQPFVDADPSFDASDFYRQFLEPLKQDGEWWGVPYEADARMIYLNLDRFAQAGISPPQADWRFVDFMDAAAALSDGDHYGFTTRRGAYDDLSFVLQGLGAHLFDYTPTAQDPSQPPKPTFDDPAVIAALSQYADLSRGKSLSRMTPSSQSGWPGGTGVGGHPTGVAEGQVAMWIDFISFYAYAPKPDFETGVAPLPVDARQTADLQINAFYISDQTTEPQACWEWLTFVSRQPVIVELLPARPSIAASPRWQDRVDATALPAYQTMLAYANTTGTPSFVEQGWDDAVLEFAVPWLDQAFQATLSGQDPGRALADVQAKVKIFLTCLEAISDPFSTDDSLVCARQADPDYPAGGVK
jgi:ABC-type glycerol-3-phosphate transport system substrate-binding protein